MVFTFLLVVGMEKTSFSPLVPRHTIVLTSLVRIGVVEVVDVIVLAMVGCFRDPYRRESGSIGFGAEEEEKEAEASGTGAPLPPPRLRCVSGKAPVMPASTAALHHH